MLTIRQEVMNQLGRHVRAQFEQRLMGEIARLFPELVLELTEDTLEAHVHSAVEEAIRRGITQERKVTWFVRAYFEAL